MEPPILISRTEKIVYWISAWGIATFLCVLTSPVMIVDLWAFPLGLFVFFTHPGSLHTLILWILGWLFYGMLIVVGFRQEQRARYFPFYTLLCALLFLNVIGYRYMTRFVFLW